MFEELPPDARPNENLLPQKHTSEYENIEKHESGAGPIIGSIIIVILLVFGALYFWGAAINRKNAPTPSPTVQQ